jgi:hypothetical protein
VVGQVAVIGPSSSGCWSRVAMVIVLMSKRAIVDVDVTRSNVESSGETDQLDASLLAWLTHLSDAIHTSRNHRAYRPSTTEYIPPCPT